MQVTIGHRSTTVRVPKYHYTQLLFTETPANFVVYVVPSFSQDDEKAGGTSSELPRSCLWKRALPGLFTEARGSMEFSEVRFEEGIVESSPALVHDQAASW